MKDDLGDRMKFYERQYTADVFLPMIPTVARLDGRSFHTFTKGLKRPYDEGMSQLMIETTKFLVEKTNANVGYTQSDEITLLWFNEDWGSSIFFEGKVHKMTSILSSMTSVFFNKNLEKYLPEKKNEMPLFDCRVFQVPEQEAPNVFIWREQDASRNSIQMAARAYFSYSECVNKSCSELQDMLHEKGVNWNNYPIFFKRGTYIRRRIVEREFTKEEIKALPEQHHIHKNPKLVVTRSVIMEEEFPILTTISNREDVLLRGADPLTNKERL